MKRMFVLEALIFVLAWSLVVSQAHATTYLDWDPAGATPGAGATPTGNWDTSTANWSLSSTGGSGSSALTIGGTGTTSLTGNNTFTGGITINSGATLILSGTITNSGSGSGTTTISAVIGTDVTGMTENAANSTLSLSGANTYTSGTTLAAGTVILIGATNTFSGGVTVYSGGTIKLNAADAISQNDRFGFLVTGTSGAGTTYMAPVGKSFVIGSLATGTNGQVGGTFGESGGNATVIDTSINVHANGITNSLVESDYAASRLFASAGCCFFAFASRMGIQVRARGGHWPRGAIAYR